MSILLSIFCLSTPVLYLWAVIDLWLKLKRKKLPHSAIHWIWVIFFFPVLGAILYFQLHGRQLPPQ